MFVAWVRIYILYANQNTEDPDVLVLMMMAIHQDTFDRSMCLMGQN